MVLSDTVLHELMRVIGDRRTASPEASYTARLLAGGVEAAGAKVLEEAAEVVEAAQAGRRDEVVGEAADLVYHLLVLLAAAGTDLAAVESELRERFGRSGLRQKGP